MSTETGGSNPTKSPNGNVTVLPPEPPPTPLYDQLIADLGPLYAPVDTEWTVLESQAVLAMAERQP
jgi:hypothetical protein